jgi:hypothetical protein
LKPIAEAGEEKVRFAGAAGPLAGTFGTPVGPARGAVLIIAGSGAIDRDGNAKRLRMNIYRDLARQLEADGFYTLRYDKRGVGESPGDALTVGLWDRVDDALAAVRYLRERAVDAKGRVIILGHSEGCILAAAANARESVEGLVLLAGPCESLAATSPRQQEQALEELRQMRGFAGFLIRLLRVPESQTRKARATMERILHAERPWIRISGVKMNVRWIQEHFAYDVAQDLPKVTCPTLAITGEKDVQVLPEHARKIADTVAGPSEWHVIPDMTHALRRTEEPIRMLSLVKLYKRQCQEPIDQELLDIVHDWLGAYFPPVGAPAS